MADIPETDKLVKKEAEGPAPDPITRRSTASILLVCALLLTGSLAWALWDEVYGQRPWKSMQTSFVQRYDRFLKRLKKKGFPSEQEVRESEGYQNLDAQVREAEKAIQPELGEIDREVALIDRQLAAISNEFQDRRGRITVINYQIETADEDDRNELREEAKELRAGKADIVYPEASGEKREQLDYTQLEERYNERKRRKAELLAERGEKLKPVVELKRQRDEYLKDNVAGVTEEQVDKLIAKNKDFEVTLRQINMQGDQMVDRCETCHLGIREPLEITARDMMPVQRSNRPDELARAFVSHPSKELLQIHDPERFGCSSCHGGNGRATTSVEKGHGRHRFWLHPMYERENMEAGCLQCHTQDRVLVGASVLNKGRDLFADRGCIGCHRYEGFDRETDAIANTRQEIKQLNEQIANNNREVNAARGKDPEGLSDEESQRLLSRIEGLIVTNSQLESRIDQLNIQARYLMQDQKKVGPNLKDVRAKLVKEWIPVWLEDPQKFRPGTKMPTYWYLSGDEKMVKGNIVPAKQQEEERKAISAYLWQSAYDASVPKQPLGNAGRGEQLFNQRGCLACHSIDREGQQVGGEFAANLSRVGEKANYDYIVRWVHNPRERLAPYCPDPRHGDLKAKDYQAVFDDHLRRRLITQEQFDRRDLSAIFGPNNSKCPEHGVELQVQNMTVMPNFRLSDQDSRDIATYLTSLSPRQNYPEARFMDSEELAAKGKELIKQYGCAGCHEIRGFEEEQRIGKELTTEGATPIERLDFALMSHEAEDGHDPLGLSEGKPWYNHKGFFEHKIADPSVYDKGKEKEPREHLRMPKPYMKDDSWRIALTTFLLGSKGVEGANVPSANFYSPTNLQKDIQEGWWVIKKYNCMGCHSIQVGQDRPVITSLPWYQEQGGELGKEHWPPGLLTEGARVDPNWLLRFLSDPSLSGISEEQLAAAAHGGLNGTARQNGQAASRSGTAGPSPQPSARSGPTATQIGASSGSSGSGPPLSKQPGENKNGLRDIEPRMPTFSFSPNELRILVRFFMAYAAQQEPYIKERLEPLTPDEVSVARALFTSDSAPCMKCHLTNSPENDARYDTRYAPSFIDAAQRLKPDWTQRWIMYPKKIWPDTTMPTDLFVCKDDPNNTSTDALFRCKDNLRVLKGTLPPGAVGYEGDHVQLLVRYMLQLDEAEQRTLAGLYDAAQSRQPQAAQQQQPPVATAHRGFRIPAPRSTGPPRRDERASVKKQRRAKRREVSLRSPPKRARTRARPPGVAALKRGGPADFSP